MTRVPISVQKNYKKIMNDVVRDFSDNVIVTSPSTKVDCPNCIFDHQTGKSAGLFDTTFVSPVVVFAGTSSEQTITPTSFDRMRCPICLGEGALERSMRTTIKALIDFFPSEIRDQRGDDMGLTWTPYGRDGKSYAILKTHEKHYELLLNALQFEFRGVKYEPIYPTLTSGVGIDALALCWIVPVGTGARIQE